MVQHRNLVLDGVPGHLVNDDQLGLLVDEVLLAGPSGPSFKSG